jgi:hypothetical protein
MRMMMRSNGTSSDSSVSGDSVKVTATFVPLPDVPMGSSVEYVVRLSHDEGKWKARVEVVDIGQSKIHIRTVDANIRISSSSGSWEQHSA